MSNPSLSNPSLSTPSGPPNDDDTEKSVTATEPKEEEEMKSKDEKIPAGFDETEYKLGIQTYMSPHHPGFSAVVKARYSDFIVHEVDLDGKIATLDSREILSGDENREATKESVAEVESKTETIKPATTPSTNSSDPADTSTPANGDESQNRKRKSKSQEVVGFDWPSLKSHLVELIGDDKIATDVISLMELHDKGEACSDKFVTLPLLEKPARKAVHDWVRESLTCARADTLEKNIRIWHISFEKEMPNYTAFGNTHKKKASIKRPKSSWPTDRPDFLRFVMYKENIDTTTATKEVSRKGNRARIGFAGMKDKRGITTQFCTLYQTEPQHILTVAQDSGGGNSKNKGYSVVQVGNFEYVSKELRLGMLRGNRFDIVLRNVQVENAEDPKEPLRKAAEALQHRGFINYFGTQRFGKYHDTHLVGLAVIKGDYRQAVEILLQPKLNERPDIANARKLWQDRFKEKGESPEVEAECAKRVMKCLSRFMTAENSIMQSLSRKPMDYKRAFSVIPKTLRLMFLHAVQSLIWNKATSYRIDIMGRDDVVEGDLVRHSGASGVHVITQEDITSKRFALEDVVLPLVGTKSKYPKNEVGELIVNQLLGELGLTLDMFGNIKDRDLELRGDYRNLLCRPTDVDFKIVEYYDALQPLLQTDLMKLNGQELSIGPKNEEDKPILAMSVGFTLPSSSYATIALRELMKRPTSSEYQKEQKLEG
jgi:tRNA pseudouridine13 synthase